MFSPALRKSNMGNSCSWPLQGVVPLLGPPQLNCHNRYSSEEPFPLLFYFLLFLRRYD
uniref:Uncharacterized protein n=1 Tax=Anguilla anguilla TaxID=7936 RepID=A0A0E9V5J9_ANGAN